MNDYHIIITIIKQMELGANLGEIFRNITQFDSLENIGKVKDITYGVARYYHKLKAILQQLATSGIKNYTVYSLLLIGIYEITYSKKPHYAIVNDLVTLSRSLTKNPKLSNFTNAILRAYLRNKESLEGDLKNNVEYKYNFPKWLITKLKKGYPKTYINIIDILNTKPKLGLRLNPRKTTLNSYTDILKQQQLPYTIYKDHIVLDFPVTIEKIPLFDCAAVTIQDVAAQQLAFILEKINTKNGDYILDACAAPGGKTGLILERYKLKLLALDINHERMNLLKTNCKRLGLSLQTKVGDASKNDWWDGRMFDKIIADLPCSATGTIKKNPDIKIHRNILDVRMAVNMQRLIVKNLWQMLKHGGSLIYITCSVLHQENQDNIARLLKMLPHVIMEYEEQILPSEYNDGFYYCVLTKKSP